MAANQEINIGIILVIGFVVGLIWINAQIRQVRWIYFYGVILMLFGLFGWVLMGKHSIQLLSLHETAGFGRAYLSGAMMVVSGLIFDCYRAIKKIISWGRS